MRSAPRVAAAVAPFACALLAPLAACSGAQPSAAPPAPQPGAAEAEEDSPLEALKRAKVYDAGGRAKACAEPRADCPPIAPDRELSDRCALGGYRMVQCGCESLCTGDVSRLGSQYHDAEGRAKTCEPASPDCSPPAASAAFQDACTEKGFHMKVCGCEWLCSGDVNRAAP